MNFTRKEVIRAIRKEKLKGNSFIEEKGPFGSLDDNCKVCAVGAVLRQASIPNEDISYFGYALTGSNGGSRFNELIHLERGLYLSALSVKFEKLYKSYGGTKKTKEALIKFVKENFPKEFEANAQDVC